jgi:zinc transporter ZupT
MLELIDPGGAVQEVWGVMTRVFLAYALALTGGVISSLVAVSHERLCRLISLAAGTLLGVTLFIIIPECYETLPLWHLAIALISGYVVFFLVSRYVFHVCPACAASHFDEAATHRFSEIATAMVVALGLHSTLDGLALAVGKEPGMLGNVDASLLLAICIHKIPEGLALGALLLASGLPRWTFLGWWRGGPTTAGRRFGTLGIATGIRIWMDLVWPTLAAAIFLAFHAVFGELVGINGLFSRFSTF